MFDVGFYRTKQLALAERLSEILIGANNPSLGFVEQAVFARKHNHRRRFKFAVIFDERAGLIAIKAGHHNVYKYDIGARISNLGQGVEAVGGSNYRTACLFQQSLRCSANCFAVVDDHNLKAFQTHVHTFLTFCLVYYCYCRIGRF